MATVVPSVCDKLLCGERFWTVTYNLVLYYA